MCQLTNVVRFNCTTGAVHAACLLMVASAATSRVDVPTSNITVYGCSCLVVEGLRAVFCGSELKGYYYPADCCTK